MREVDSYSRLRKGTDWNQSQHPECPECGTVLIASEAWDDFDLTILGWYCDCCGRLWEDWR